MKSYIKKLMTGMGQAINKQKPNVPKTEIQKAIRDLKISTQKSKAGTAKLNQTMFELKQNKDFTFARNKKKTESNTEKYKRIQKDNSKVMGKMIKKVLKGDK